MSEYKRGHLRIKKNLPVEIITPGKRPLFATTCDISKHGVQLVCDAITVQEIFGGPGVAVPVKLPNLILKLRLNHPERAPQQIDIECKVIFSRRVAEQEYRVGLLIHALAESSRAALDRFVDDGELY